MQRLDIYLTDTVKLPFT